MNQRNQERILDMLKINYHLLKGLRKKNTKSVQT